jgi:hypothetical protein
MEVKKLETMLQELRIPLKPSRLNIRRTNAKYIIIHHTSEQYLNPSLSIDNANFQLRDLMKGVLELKQADINYHFLIEQIKDDFHVIMARPFATLCEFDDIDNNINNTAIHIGLIGNYDFKIPDPRLYQVLGYRCISPLLKTFKINPERIKLHSEVSLDNSVTCPGEFFDKEALISATRKYLLK